MSPTAAPQIERRAALIFCHACERNTMQEIRTWRGVSVRFCSACTALVWHEGQA